MMTSLHNSASTLDDTMPAIPMRITHSFPPKGIVANILTNNKNTKVNPLNGINAPSFIFMPNNFTSQEESTAMTKWVNKTICQHIVLML